MLSAPSERLSMVFLWLLSTWPILPNTRPSGLVIPSIAWTEPLRLNLPSIVAFPVSSAYWNAICPLDARLWTVLSSAMNLPSPWLMGTRHISPEWNPDIHGLITDDTRTRAMCDICLPIVLNVSVGLSGDGSRNSPYGRSPSFTSAWKPLHIPPTSPFLLSRRSVTASFTAGLRMNAVMNFPDPSGSSAPENPPGMKSIWLLLTAFAKPSMLFLIALSSRFDTTKISASAPASSNALFVSISQFVPGNTGIMTCGLTALPNETDDALSYVNVSACPSPSAVIG